MGRVNARPGGQELKRAQKLANEELGQLHRNGDTCRNDDDPEDDRKPRLNRFEQGSKIDL